MGSPLDHALTDIFVGFTVLSSPNKLVVYFRYVDTFCLFNPGGFGGVFFFFFFFFYSVNYITLAF